MTNQLWCHHLILESKEDVKRFIEALRIREIKNAMREQMDDAHSHIEVEKANEILKRPTV